MPGQSKSIRLIIILTILIIAAAVTYVITIDTHGGSYNETGKTPPAPSPTPQPKDINVLIIGDSIARGTGDETEHGIESYLPDYLKSPLIRKANIANEGINGLISRELAERLAMGEWDKYIRISDLIIISIGGNDILDIGNMNYSEIIKAYKNKKEIYDTSLSSAIKHIRSVNQNSIMVFIGLYVPYIAEKTNLIPDELYTFFYEWNKTTSITCQKDPKAIYIETYEIFKQNGEKYTSDDLLHPNSAGYRAISELIGKAYMGADK